MKTHTVFKTLTIGTDTPENLIKKIEASGDRISSYAKDIASKIKPCEKETIYLVMIKLSDWFKKYPTTTELFERAEQEGLESCPPITGLELRLAYEDQPKSDYFLIGMERITASDGYPRVFDVERHGDGERWLDTDWTDDDTWRLGTRIVFRLRKSALGTSETQDSVLNPLETLNLESAIKMVKDAVYKIIKEL